MTAPEQQFTHSEVIEALRLHNIVGEEAELVMSSLHLVAEQNEMKRREEAFEEMLPKTLKFFAESHHRFEHGSDIGEEEWADNVYVGALQVLANCGERRSHGVELDEIAKAGRNAAALVSFVMAVQMGNNEDHDDLYDIAGVDKDWMVTTLRDAFISANEITDEVAQSNQLSNITTLEELSELDGNYWVLPYRDKIGPLVDEFVQKLKDSGVQLAELNSNGTFDDED